MILWPQSIEAFGGSHENCSRVAGAAGGISPATGREGGIVLQYETRPHRFPTNDHVGTAFGDEQSRCACRERNPKAAMQAEWAAAVKAGIGLSEGPPQAIAATGARAAAAIDGKPIDGEVLRCQGKA